MSNVVCKLSKNVQIDDGRLGDEKNMDLVHLPEWMLDRKRISAYSNPNLNPKPNSNPNPKAQTFLGK